MEMTLKVDCFCLSIHPANDGAMRPSLCARTCSPAQTLQKLDYWPFMNDNFKMYLLPLNAINYAPVMIHKERHGSLNFRQKVI